MLRSLSAGPMPIVNFSALAHALAPVEVEMKHARGNFVFNNDRVELKDVTVNVAGNNFAIDRIIDGYSAEAAATVNIESIDDVRIPASSIRRVDADCHPRDLSQLPPAGHGHCVGEVRATGRR